MKKALSLLLSLLLTFSLLLPALGEGEVDTVSSTSMFLAMTEGEVAVTNMAGDSLDLTEDMRLFNGCTVDTAAESYAWVTLDDSKFVTLDQLSSASIHKENYDLLLTVNAGTMYFNVTEKLRDDESMDIETATMITGIRGTSGRVQVFEDGSTILTLLSGVVSVQARDVNGTPWGEIVTLEAGYSIRSYRDDDNNGVLEKPMAADISEIHIPESVLSPCSDPEGHDYEGAEPTYTCSPDELLCTARVQCIHCEEPLSVTVKNEITASTPATCEEEGIAERLARFAPYNEIYRDNHLDLKDHTCGGTIPATGHRWPIPDFIWYSLDDCRVVRRCLNDNSHVERKDASLMTAITDPTCTIDGFRTVTATVRMQGTERYDTRTEVIPAKGHSLTAVAAVSPTCTAGGTATYWKCSVCGSLFGDAAGTSAISAVPTLPATGHTLTGTAAVPATCTANGTAAYWQCSVCGGLFGDAAGSSAISAPATLPAGHTLTANAGAAPTCTAPGTAAYWQCTACRGLFSDAAGTSAIPAPVSLPALGHTYVVSYTWQINNSGPNATAMCIAKVDCPTCGTNFRTVPQDAKHNGVNWFAPFSPDPDFTDQTHP